MVPSRFGDIVNVVGHNCLGQCSKNLEAGGPPYVQVDDEIIPDASIEKVLQYLEIKLK
jgi:NADH:ubiquinone oxidoreductase subunit E